jgi:hypothetical protein
VQNESLHRRAKHAGVVNVTTVYRRIRKGWPVDDAIKTPAWSPNPDSVTQRAKRGGVPPGTARNRIGRGWSVEDATTVAPKRCDPDSVSQRAKRNGISRQTAFARIRKFGWSVDDATTVPIRQKPILGGQFPGRSRSR